MSESPFTKTEPQLNIGLLGYGTVGRTVAELLDERDCGIRIRHILRRPGHADGPLTYDPALLCGTGHFPDEVLPGRPLAELIEIARQKQSFLAFEPQATE